MPEHAEARVLDQVQIVAEIEVVLKQLFAELGAESIQIVGSFIAVIGSVVAAAVLAAISF